MKAKSSQAKAKKTGKGGKSYGVRRCSAALVRASRKSMQSAAAAAHSKKWPVEGMAELIADSICHEVSQFLRVKMPEARYVQLLAAKAERCLQGNAQFRRKMNGTRCREWLHTFMRHWMASLLKCERPDLLAMIPKSFDTGHPLPAGTGRRVSHRGGTFSRKTMKWEPARLQASSQWNWLQAA